MVASVTLFQKRSLLSDDRYRVESVIQLATPAELYGAFVAQYDLPDYPWEEYFVRVATLEDLAHYIENALADFRQTGFNPLTCPGGPVTPFTDYLDINPTPEEWYEPAVSVATFQVIAADATRIQVTPDFPRAANGLHWSLRHGSDPAYATGTAGEASPATHVAASPYLRRHWVGVYNLVSSAEAHSLAVDTGVHSLATAANTTPPPFIGSDTKVYP